MKYVALFALFLVILNAPAQEKRILRIIVEDQDIITEKDYPIGVVGSAVGDITESRIYHKTAERCATDAPGISLKGTITDIAIDGTLTVEYELIYKTVLFTRHETDDGIEYLPTASVKSIKTHIAMKSGVKNMMFSNALTDEARGNIANMPGVAVEDQDPPVTISVMYVVEPEQGK